MSNTTSTVIITILVLILLVLTHLILVKFVPEYSSLIDKAKVFFTGEGQEIDQDYSGNCNVGLKTLLYQLSNQPAIQEFTYKTFCEVECQNENNHCVCYLNGKNIGSRNTTCELAGIPVKEEGLFTFTNAEFSCKGDISFLDCSDPRLTAIESACELNNGAWICNDQKVGCFC